VQRSVFLGDLQANRAEEIFLFSQELLDIETDSVYIFPMSREEYDKVRIVGLAFDKALVADHGKRTSTVCKTKELCQVSDVSPCPLPFDFQ
jgi:CRISPR-associated protein Cas2